MAESLLSVESLAGDHSEEIREILSPADHPSIFEDYQTFQLLNVRRMSMTASLSFVSEAFLIQSGAVFLYSRDDGFFRRLEGGYEPMVQSLENYYSGNQKILRGYSDEIEKLEDSLFERKVPSYFMDIWFDLKKDLAKIENFYYRNAVIYREFHKKCEKTFGEWNDEFKDIDDLINFQSSNVVTLKARMDSLHHYYDSIKSDRLNKTLLALTMISGIFLPLNLIVGFFGMNTEGLYFKGNPDGTQAVFSILLGIVGISLLGVPLVKMVDKYVLRILLGRYNFYKSIAHKIGRTEDATKALKL